MYIVSSVNTNVIRALVLLISSILKNSLKNIITTKKIVSISPNRVPLYLFKGEHILYRYTNPVIAVSITDILLCIEYDKLNSDAKEDISIILTKTVIEIGNALDSILSIKLPLTNPLLRSSAKKNDGAPIVINDINVS